MVNNMPQTKPDVGDRYLTATNVSAITAQDAAMILFAIRDHSKSDNHWQTKTMPTE